MLHFALFLFLVIKTVKHKKIIKTTIEMKKHFKTKLKLKLDNKSK